MTDTTGTPWLLRGRTGRLIGRWLERHSWELHRIVRDQYGMPLAKVRIQPGRMIRASDVDDVRTVGRIGVGDNGHGGPRFWITPDGFESGDRS